MSLNLFSECVGTDVIYKRQCAVDNSPGCKNKLAPYSKNTSVEGYTCQKWSENTPHAHAYNDIAADNQCRNPSNSKAPWCYVIPPSSDPNAVWKYCYPNCGTF